MAERPRGRSRDHAPSDHRQRQPSRQRRPGCQRKRIDRGCVTVSERPFVLPTSRRWRVQVFGPSTFLCTSLETRARSRSPFLCQACRMCTPAERRFFAPPLPSRVSPLSGLLNKAAMCMSQPYGAADAARSWGVIQKFNSKSSSVKKVHFSCPHS